MQTARASKRTGPSGKAVGNRILLSLSDTDYRRIRPYLEFELLPARRILHEPREKLRFAYFLNRGLASIVVAMHSGRDVEAGVVGHEGFVGTPLAVGLSRSPLSVIMQIEGDGFRITANALQTSLESMPELRMMLSRYAVLQGMQTAQTAACNRLHDVSQRLARWLLMAEDRVHAPVLPITHEFLATMLGTDRSSVTIAAGALQKKKIIRYTRGDVRILHRRRLEKAACSCYRVIQKLNGSLGLTSRPLQSP